MNRTSKVSLLVFLTVTLSIILIICGLVKHVSAGLIVVLLLWLAVIAYCLSDVSKHIVLLLFLASFFVFLLGREFCFYCLGLKRYYLYLEPYNDITWLLIIISFIFLFVGYKLADVIRIHGTKIQVKTFRKNKRESQYCFERIGEKHKITVKRKAFQKASFFAFSFCYVISLVDVIQQIKIVRSIGYLGTYAESNAVTSKILGYFTSFTIVALSIYLATYPTKRKCFFAIVCYEIYGILTMLTGHRYTFIAISMFSLTYIVYRNRQDGRWISKRIGVYILVAVPIVLFVMNYIDAIRAGNTNKNNGLLGTIVNFLDQQGGSINVIKRVLYYKRQLKDMSLTSFSNVRTVFLENALMRKLFNIQVYAGNSIENAMHGHYLSHRLSYYEYGDLYLIGHGVGSCYIAELYHDFGTIGVVFGNILYGVLIQRITNPEYTHWLRNGMLLASQYFIYLAPRGDFDGFVGGLFSLTAILGILGIIVLSYCIKGTEKNVKKNAEKSISKVL